MSSILLLGIAAAALITDIRTGKIPNALILTGYVIGWSYQIADKGILGLLVFSGGAVLPIFLLGIIYYFRMMGAGDIKLLSVLGGIMGLSQIFLCILTAILTGGIISVVLVLKRRNLKKRIWYFFDYFREYKKTKVWKSYRNLNSSKSHFYFTIPILISVILYVGGIY